MKIKQLLVSMGLVASIFAFTGFSHVEAQTIDITQFRQVIELFIALGIIAPDKVDQVRFAFGISTTTPPATSTSTPIFGVSQSSQQIDATDSPILGALVPVSAPVSSNVSKVALGDTYCSTYVSVGIPVYVEGSDWSKVVLSYVGFQPMAIRHGVQGAPINNPQQREIELLNQIRGYRLTESLSTSTPTVYLDNIPGSYPLTVTVYNRSGKIVGTVTQPVVIPNECRTSMSNQLLPIIHGDGTFNGQLQSDGSWADTTTTSPYKD